MRTLNWLLLALLLLGCGDGVDAEKGTDKAIVNRKWVLQQVTAGTSPSVSLNQQAYLIFKDDGQISSNFSNCYSYRVRKRGEILVANNCIDCICPPGGCANGLACNESVWTYQLAGNTLLLTVGGWFSGVFMA